jgi:hypothetical protein
LILDVLFFFRFPFISNSACIPLSPSAISFFFFSFLFFQPPSPACRVLAAVDIFAGAVVPVIVSEQGMEKTESRERE